MRKTVLTALVGLTVLAAAQTADAQYYGGGGYGYGAPPPPPRWGYRHRIHGYVGAQLTGIGIINQKTDNNMREYLGAGGGGGGLFGGVRLGPFFSLELNWNLTYHNAVDDYDYWGHSWSAFTLNVVELDAKIHIPTRGMIEPYAQVGVGGAFVGVSWDEGYAGGDYLLAKGFTFNIGGGLDIWLSPFVSLGGRVLYKGLRFGEGYVVNGHTVYANYASAVNVDLNVALHF